MRTTRAPPPRRQPRPQGRFHRNRTPAPRRRPSVPRSGKRQQEGGVQAVLGRITRMAPGFLSRSARSGGRSPSSGPFGLVRGLTGKGGGRGGLPLNAKTLTGVLGAGAAGTALVRKRRAGRGEARTTESEPT
jgi:hypothetical protein